MGSVHNRGVDTVMGSVHDLASHGNHVTSLARETNAVFQIGNSVLMIE